ncbi:MAG: O-antigen ligase family protein [Proteobacteria bacterium]|nr:O-antigen ligase family protein [Pseudomonadota bacterium]
MPINRAADKNLRLIRYILPLTGLYLFTLNIPHATTIQETSFFLALILTLYSILKEKNWPHAPLRLPFILWVCLGVLSLLFSADVYFSAEMIKKEILYYILAFWLCYTVTRNQKNFLFLSGALLASAVVIIAASGYYYLIVGMDEVTIGHVGILYGQRAYYTNFILSGALLCLALVPLKNIHTSIRLFCLALLPICMLALYFAKLRAGYLSLLLIVCAIIGTVVVRMTSYKAKIALVALICVILFVSVFFIVDINLNSEISLSALKRYGTEERWAIWMHFINTILAHPMIGAGFGIKDFVLTEFGGRELYPHNLFLSYGVMLGVPGMGVLALLFGSIARLLLKGLSVLKHDPNGLSSVPFAGLLLLGTFFVLNLTSDVMVEHSGELFWSLMGIFIGYCARAERKLSETPE